MFLLDYSSNTKLKAFCSQPLLLLPLTYFCLKVYHHLSKTCGGSSPVFMADLISQGRGTVSVLVAHFPGIAP